MTLSYTPRFHLAVPDFLSEPWHAEFAAAMESIDQALFTAIVAQETNAWIHDHHYAIGDLIIDSTTGTLYSCAVDHVSSSALTAPTFAEELAAHPTYWTSFAVIAASQTEAELGVDNNKYMTPLRTAQAITAQSPTPGIATVAQAQEGQDNTQIMTPKRVFQSIDARIATQAQAVAGTVNDVLMTPLRTEQLIVSAGVAGGDTIGFSAHKGGTSQTGIASLVSTKITFGTELYDSGSFYDTANSRWTPPSGQVHIDAAIQCSNATIPSNVNLLLYKNGVQFKVGFVQTSTAAQGVQLSIDDITNGTDYYELFINGSTGTTITIDGLAANTYFMGAFLGEVGVVTIGLAEVGFRASKGGTAQPGIPNQVWTKMSFTSEEYDQGGFYDSTLSRWIPPTGIVSLTAAMVATGAIAIGGTAGASIFKNGALLKQGIDAAANGGLASAQITVDDVASGTDYYEAFAYVSTGGAVSVDGAAFQTYFTGHRIKGAQGEQGPTGATGPTGSTVSPSINCGRLRYVSPTQLSFLPFNGGHIKINGVLVAIPTSGIVGLTNSNAYVNGVAGQPLVSGTTYYVYAFVNAGVITADFSVTGHATSVALTNEGTEIKSGDNTRTLIGMVRAAGGTTPGQFFDAIQNRLVLSWFNRRSVRLQGPAISVYYGPVGAWYEVHGSLRINFLTWGDEVVPCGVTGTTAMWDTGDGSVYTGIALDQVTGAGAGLQFYNLGTAHLQWWMNAAVSGVLELTEGFHFITAIANGSYGAYHTIGTNGVIRG